MRKLVCIWILSFAAKIAHGGIANSNSVLIGERAAGMGGAFAALTDDAAACSYYNPATLARMQGASLSATANLYAKYETKYGNQEDFASAPLRVNQGSIVPIPASSGSVYTFGNFAAGLSIVLPHKDQYTGAVQTSPTTTATINLNDESLWVGGTLALNVSEKSSLGLTMYYTSRTFARSLNDREDSGVVSITNEETLFSNNGLIYVLGAWHKLSPNWSTGLSVRLPYLEVSGSGSYYRFQLTSGGGNGTSIARPRLKSNTSLPTLIRWGIAYERPKVMSVAMDLTYSGSDTYYTFDDRALSDRYDYQPTINVQMGAEYYLHHWLALRMGLFTNFSNFEAIGPDSMGQRRGDHIDMWGFSTNVALYTSKQSQVTLGGYYTGGKGDSVQFVGGGFQKVPKSVQMFSFLVGTAFQF